MIAKKYFPIQAYDIDSHIVEIAQKGNIPCDFDDIKRLNDNVEKISHADYFDIKLSESYIPFNFDEESRYEKLIDALKGSSLDTDALLQGDIDYIKEHRTAINNAYKKVVKSRNSNDSSLIVYSGPTYTGHSFYRKYNFKFGYCRTSPRPSLKKVACLYLGDTNLNQKSEKMNLCHALSYHLNNVKENIGLIQVPHHGSKHNFNDDILFISEGACAYFASFGRRNHFGHPSYRVVEDIVMHGSFVGITEDRDSAFIDVIYKR